MTSLVAAAIASIDAHKKYSEMKQEKRSKILEGTPKNERWKVLALWEAADSIPSCNHQTSYYGGSNRSFDWGFF